MMPFGTLAFGTHLIIAVANGVPTFNVEPSCKVAGNTGGDLRREACLRTEKEARDKLGTEWNAFAVADRTRCVETSTMGGASRSYVELLTCLEIARDVRKLPKENSSPIESDGTSRRRR